MHEIATVVEQARQDPSLVVLEGFHAVKHALRFGGEVGPVLTSELPELLTLAAQLAPDLVERLRGLAREVDAAVWDAIGAGSLPTPALGIAQRPDGRSFPTSGPRVLLEDPRHLGNLGASIRVAAAAGAAAVLTTGTADPWHPSAVRASAGLHFAVRVERIDDLASLRAPLVAVDPAGMPLGTTDLPADAVYAFGTERLGLSESLRERTVTSVAIPMREGVSSLNLATAVAVVLYHHRGTIA